MRRWKIELTEHELRLLLEALDMERAAHRPRRDLDRLYERLRDVGYREPADRWERVE